MKAVVLKVKSYNFTNEQTKQQVSGFRLSFVPLGMPCENNALGVSYIVEKSCSDLSKFSVFSSNVVPAVYDITFQSSYNSKGNLVERPIDFKFDRPLKLDDLL